MFLWYSSSVLYMIEIS